MTREEALKTLKRIQNDPSIADQFTEEEIEQLEYEASKKA
jgi:predicted transcriptional regulator